MSAVSREQLRTLMGEVLAAQGKTLPADESARPARRSASARSTSPSSPCGSRTRSTTSSTSTRPGCARSPPSATCSTCSPRSRTSDRGPIRRSGQPRRRRPRRVRTTRGRTCPHVELAGAGGRRGAASASTRCPPSARTRGPAPSCSSSPPGRLEQNLRDGAASRRASPSSSGGDVESATEPARAGGRPALAAHLRARPAGPSGSGTPWQSLTTVSGELPPRRWLCPYSPGTYAWWQVVTLGLAQPGPGPGRGRPRRPRRLGRGRRSSTASPRPRARRPSGGRRS